MVIKGNKGYGGEGVPDEGKGIKKYINGQTI
jgi:hypothetical protein